DVARHGAYERVAGGQTPLVDELAQGHLDEVGVGKVVLDGVEGVAHGTEALRSSSERHGFAELALGVLLSSLDPIRQAGRSDPLLDHLPKGEGVLLFDPGALTGR